MRMTIKAYAAAVPVLALSVAATIVALCAKAEDGKAHGVSPLGLAQAPRSSAAGTIGRPDLPRAGCGPSRWRTPSACRAEPGDLASSGADPPPTGHLKRLTYRRRGGRPAFANDDACRLASPGTGTRARAGRMLARHAAARSRSGMDRRGRAGISEYPNASASTITERRRGQSRCGRDGSAWCAGAPAAMTGDPARTRSGRWRSPLRSSYPSAPCARRQAGSAYVPP